MAAERAEDVAVVGGGLVGSLLAIFLKRRGRDVAVYERRSDLTRGPLEGGRSINLVLTSRGLSALAAVGLEQGALELTVPVLGRMMHALDGKRTYQPYGRDDSECNHSISRGALNRFLVLAAIERGVRFHFERRFEGADFATGRLRFEDPAVVEARLTVGADGAGSAVRSALVQASGGRESIDMLGHDYKELLIPPAGDGSWVIEQHALHIWPRGDRMLMALPNTDGSFTATLYLPRRGPHGFEALRSADDVRRLFEELFSDALPLLPHLAEDFFVHPTGELGTVRCDPWHLGRSAVLVGDAAHAIVPFFGQGMNAGFEDCVVLDGLLDRHGPEALAAFSRARKADADAIADMALENFVEMSERVGDPRFLLRKEVEHRLEQELPDAYRTRYSMVMYSSIPYHRAQQAGRIQQGILDELCAGLSCADDLDLTLARRLVRERLSPFLAQHAIDLSY